MKAFHDDKTIKEKYLMRVKAHQIADEIIKEQYWKDEEWRTIGIPEWLAYVEDRLVDGLSNKSAKEFPLRFLTIIKIGVDLEKVKVPFLIFILERTLNTFDHEKFPKVKEALECVISLYKRDNSSIDEFKDAEMKAREAAQEIPEASIWSVEELAAETAARAAETTSRAVERTVQAAGAAARTSENEYEKFADKLIELIENLK